MRAGRIVTLFLAAIFALQGTDCLTLLFPDQPAHKCCQKRLRKEKSPDRCCQVSPNATVSQGEAKQKAPLLDPAALQVGFIWPSLTEPDFVAIDSSQNLTFAPSPPGELGNFSLPLLV